MNEKLFSNLIMVDLRKAFHTVCHKKLVNKLNHYGIRGIVYELISNYLLNRKQYVYLNGVRSFLQSINIGVPQGSILGPLLYLIYVNDLPSCLQCALSLYADDTCMIVHDQCLSELEGKVCKNISDLKVWLIPFDAVGTYMSLDIAKQYQKFISAVEMPWDGIDRYLTSSRIM